MPITNKLKGLINCERGTRELYRSIAGSKYFEGGNKKEINLVLVFCLSVSFGFREKKFFPIKSGRRDYITRVEYLASNTNLFSFIEAVAVAHHKSLEILSNEKGIIEIAESYANGGIKMLYTMVFPGPHGADFDKELESMINSIVKQKKLIS